MSDEREGSPKGDGKFLVFLGTELDILAQSSHLFKLNEVRVMLANFSTK